MASALDDRVKAALSKSLQKIAELKGRINELETQLEAERTEHTAEVSRLNAKHKDELAAAIAAATSTAAAAAPSAKKRARQPTTEPKSRKKSGKATAQSPPAQQKASFAAELPKSGIGKRSAPSTGASGGKNHPSASATSRFLGIADPGAAFEETSSEDEAEAAPAVQFKPTPKDSGSNDTNSHANGSSTTSAAASVGKGGSLGQIQPKTAAELRSSLMEDSSEDSDALDIDKEIAVLPAKVAVERHDGTSKDEVRDSVQSSAVARLRSSLMDDDSDDSDDSEDLDLEGIETVPATELQNDVAKDMGSTISRINEKVERDIAPENAVDDDEYQGSSSSSDNDSDVEQSIGVGYSRGVDTARSSSSTATISVPDLEWRERVLAAAKRLRKAQAKAAVSGQKQSENAYQQAMRQLKQTSATTAAETKRKASLEATAASHAAAARIAFAARAVQRSRLAVRVTLERLAKVVDNAAAEITPSNLGLNTSEATTDTLHNTSDADSRRCAVTKAAAETAGDLCFVVATFGPQCSSIEEEGIGPAWLASEIVTWWQYRLPQAFGSSTDSSASVEQPSNEVNGTSGRGLTSGRSGLLIVKGSHDQHGGGLFRPHLQEGTTSGLGAVANAVAAVQAAQLRLASLAFVTLVLHATCPSSDNSQPLPDLLDSVCAVLANRVIEGAIELHVVSPDELNQWRAQKDTAASKARAEKKRRAKNKGGADGAVATSSAQAVATAMAKAPDESTVTTADAEEISPNHNGEDAGLDTSEDEDEEVGANNHGSDHGAASDDVGGEDSDFEEEVEIKKEAGSAGSSSSASLSSTATTATPQLASFASSLGPFVTARLMAGLGMAVLAKQWSQPSPTSSSTSNTTGARWVREVIHRAFLRAFVYAPDALMHPAGSTSSGLGAARAATKALPLPELAGITEAWPGVLLVGPISESNGGAGSGNLEYGGGSLWCAVVKNLVAISLRAAISSTVSNAGNLQASLTARAHEEEDSKAAPSVGPVAQYFLTALEKAAEVAPAVALEASSTSRGVPSSVATLTPASDDPAALLSTLVSLAVDNTNEDLTTSVTRSSLESTLETSYEFESLLRRTGLRPAEPRDWDGTMQSTSVQSTNSLPLEAQRALALVSRAPPFRAAARAELGSIITRLASSASSSLEGNEPSFTVGNLVILRVLTSSQRALWLRFGGSSNSLLSAALATFTALVADESKRGKEDSDDASVSACVPSVAAAAAEALFCLIFEDVSNLENIITWLKNQRQKFAACPLPPILAAHLPALFPKLNAFASPAHYGTPATRTTAHGSNNSSSSSSVSPAVMECWVINLARRPDRWDALLRQAAKLNASVHKTSATALSGSLLTLRRCAAVDGTAAGSSGSGSSNMPRFEEVALSWDSRANAVYDSKCVASAALPLSASERACAASHLSLWRTLCRRPSTHTMGDRAIILEDDVSLHTKFPLAVAELWATLDKLDAEGHEWDVCFLGYMEPQLQQAQKKGGKGGGKGSGKAQQRSFVEESRRRPELEVIGDDVDEDGEVGDNEKRAPRPELRRIKDVKQSHLLVVPGFSWGLHAYVLRRSGAAKLTRSLPIDAPVDVFMSSLAVGGCHLKAIALTQKVASQDKALGSDIAHSGMLRRGA